MNLTSKSAQRSMKSFPMISGSPIKPSQVATPTKVELKQDFERYIRDTDGLGSLAKQVILIIYYFLSASNLCIFYIIGVKSYCQCKEL